MQLTCVINRTACRPILAGASSLVDSANTMLAEACTSEQREENLAANSAAARKFKFLIEFLALPTPIRLDYAMDMDS